MFRLPPLKSPDFFRSVYLLRGRQKLSSISFYSLCIRPEFSKNRRSSSGYTFCFCFFFSSINSYIPIVLVCDQVFYYNLNAWLVTKYNNNNTRLHIRRILVLVLLRIFLTVFSCINSQSNMSNSRFSETVRMWVAAKKYVCMPTRT